MFLRLAYFVAHAFGYGITKNPQLLAFSEQDTPEEKTELTAVRIVLIHKLWVEQMWCERNCILLYSEATIVFCALGICFYITSEWRTDEYERAMYGLYL